MALAIDGSSPAIVTQTSGTTATLVTASFTPPAGALLLIGWSGNTGTASDPGAPAITDSLGAHLTYALIGWKHRSVAPTVDGQAAMWWATVGSSAAMTVTVTTGTGSGAQQAALKVWVLTGQAGSPIGGSGIAGSASAASIAQAYTAQATGSQGFAAVCDWDLKGAETAGTGCTMDGSANVGTDITYAFARRSSADGSLGVGTSLNVTLPGTSTNLSWVYAEVKPAGTAAPAFPPSQQVRRRLGTAPRLPRGSARTATPVRDQVNPPFPFTGLKQPRRLRALAPRRGEAWAPVPPQVVVTAPSFPPRPVRSRLKGLRLFRPEAFNVVPAQVTPLAPAFPPQGLRAKVRGLRLFRGRTSAPVRRQGVPPEQERARTRPQVRVRGRIAGPPVAQVTVIVPVYPPQGWRTRLRFLRQQRARIASPVPAQIVVAPPAYPPPAVRTRLRGLRLFRPRASWPLPGHGQPPAARVPHERPRVPWLRRGHASMPAPPQVAVVPPAYPLRSVRARLKGLRSHRGHQSAMPVPPQIIVVAPKIAPLFTRVKLRALRLFRGKTVTPVMATCVCETHRPNLGTTGRPGAGITARPGSGVTLRPASGMTFRPDDGTTTPPCSCSGGS